MNRELKVEDGLRRQAGHRRGAHVREGGGHRAKRLLKATQLLARLDRPRRVVLDMLLIVLMIAAVLAAFAGWGAARRAERLLGRAAARGRLEHWRRLAEAVVELRASALLLVGAHDPASARWAARRFGLAGDRVGDLLSVGPQPRRVAERLPLLLDRTGPERLVRSRACDDVLDEVRRLEALAGHALRGGCARAGRSPAAAAARLARARAALRLSRLGAVPPR